jgi:hypothetical protein
MYRAKQVAPHHLCNAAGFIAVGLVHLRLENASVWRVSMQITRRLTLARPSNNHCDKGPASSRPLKPAVGILEHPLEILRMAWLLHLAANLACFVDDARAVSFNETCNPALYSMLRFSL